jgi:hypothetical protein
VFLGLGTGDTKSILPIIIDPQVQNSYSYGKNNPIALKDPSGNAPSQFAQVFDSFAHEYYGDWKSYLTNPVFLVDPLVFFADGVIAKGIAHDLLIATDSEQPISAQLLAIGSLGLNFVGGEGAVGKGITKAAPKVANGLSLGQSFGKLGVVVENTAGKIKTFDPHAIFRMVQRGVSRDLMESVVANPLAVLKQAGDNMLYLTREAGVVLDSAGKAITTYTKNEFKPHVLSVLNSIIK